eukprot:1211626-Ditylum_brightwellii.AAC.1
MCCTGAPIGVPTSAPKLTTAHGGDNPAHLLYKIGSTLIQSTVPGPIELLLKTVFSTFPHVQLHMGITLPPVSMASP